MNFVFTGRCTYRGDAWTRANMERLVQQAGHNIQSSVGNQTHYLVASRMDTRKAVSAERFGVSVITYDIFMTMMENSLRELNVDLAMGNVRSRIDFEMPPRVVGRMGDLPDPRISADLMAARRGDIRRPNLSSPLDHRVGDNNPCAEIHLPKDHRVTSKNRPVRTVAHGGRIRRNLDL